MKALKVTVLILLLVVVLGFVAGIIYWNSPLYQGCGSDSGWTGFKNHVISKENYYYTNPVDGEEIEYYFGADGNPYTMSDGEECMVAIPQYEVDESERPLPGAN